MSLCVCTTCKIGFDDYHVWGLMTHADHDAMFTVTHKPEELNPAFTKFCSSRCLIAHIIDKVTDAVVAAQPKGT